MHHRHSEMPRLASRRRFAVSVASAVLLLGCAGCGGEEVVPGGPAPTVTACATPELPPGVATGDATIHFTAECLPFVQTPEDRFQNLAEFPFQPHYAVVDGLRMHYVDQGPRDGEVVLMLHGEPSWSYLYRKMIPIIAAAGFRAIAVDHIGMGRSDKPVQFEDYRYLRHVAWLEQFMDALGLDAVTLFCQDWGSLIGLRVVGDRPERFARVVVANGRLPVVPAGVQLIQLPDPPVLNPALPFPFAQPCLKGQLPCFQDWATYALTSPSFRASEVVEAGTVAQLTLAEAAAYDAPFPALIYMTGARVFPSLINTLGDTPTNEGARAVFDEWEKPLLTLWGRQDPNMGSEAVQAELRDTVPGAQGQPHYAYADASHFVQEDKGADLAQRVVSFMQANPRR